MGWGSASPWPRVGASLSLPMWRPCHERTLDDRAPAAVANTDTEGWQDAPKKRHGGQTECASKDSPSSWPSSSTTPSSRWSSRKSALPKPPTTSLGRPSRCRLPRPLRWVEKAQETTGMLDSYPPPPMGALTFLGVTRACLQPCKFWINNIL
jgi:hypothetical protein